MRVWLLVLTLLVGADAFAKKKEDPANPPIKAGAEIVVDDYHKELQIFLVTMTSARDQGPNFASAKDLRAAIEYDGSLEDFIKSSSQMIGTVYILKKPLPMIDGEDVLKKYKKLHPRKK